MTSKANFDYHLSSSEQKKVEKIVPLHQAKIFIAFKADFKIIKDSYKGGAIALSEHMIVLCKKSFIGYSYSSVKMIHLLDIRVFRVPDEFTVVLETPDSEIVIVSKVCMRFSRILLRNYILVTKLWPPPMRFLFSPNDPGEFPEFNPKLSPSQMFQFLYNAYCSYFNSDYFHSIVRFFHMLMTTGNGIADFSFIPLSEIDVSFGDPLSLRPVFAAFLFCPMVFGYTMKNICRPDALKSIVPLIANNRSIKILQVSGCRIESGINELAQVMAFNDGLSIVFYDLSNNRFSDLSPFAIALSKIPKPVCYINLSNTNMNQVASLNMMKALIANKALRELRYILMHGASMSEEGVNLFVRHISELDRKNHAVLRQIDLGVLHGGVDLFLGSLKKTIQPIEYLSLSGTKIGSKAFSELISFIENSKYLKKIDLSDTGLDIKAIELFSRSISENDNIKEFTLHLDGLGLNGKNLINVLSILSSDNVSKWTGLSLKNNGIKASHIMEASPLFKQLSNLRYLSISGNLHKGMKFLNDTLLELQSHPSLDTLDISGNSSNYIGYDGITDFIRAMHTNSHIFVLDISNNQIGDKGLEEVSDMLKNNSNIVEIQIDGSKPSSPKALLEILESISQHPSLNSVNFPNDDVFGIAQQLSNEKSSKFLSSASKRQNKAQIQMQKNQARRGIHSDLSKLQMSELDETIDSIIIGVQEMLSTANVNQHSAIGKLFNLQFPHLEEDSTDLGIEIQHGNVDESVINDYACPEARISIIEPVNEAEEGSFQTLQFNSLCLRRPGAEDRFRRRGMNSPSDQSNPSSQIPGAVYSSFSPPENIEETLQ